MGIKAAARTRRLVAHQLQLIQQYLVTTLHLTNHVIPRRQNRAHHRQQQRHWRLDRAHPRCPRRNGSNKLRFLLCRRRIRSRLSPASRNAPLHLRRRLASLRVPAACRRNDREVRPYRHPGAERGVDAFRRPRGNYRGDLRSLLQYKR